MSDALTSPPHAAGRRVFLAVALLIAAAALGALMMLGLLLQLRFAAVFHRGGWGF